MECKECENYKPKNNGKSSDFERIWDLCGDYCGARECSKCEVGYSEEESSRCPINKIWGMIDGI